MRARETWAYIPLLPDLELNCRSLLKLGEVIEWPIARRGKPINFALNPKTRQSDNLAIRRVIASSSSNFSHRVSYSPTNNETHTQQNDQPQKSQALRRIELPTEENYTETKVVTLPSRNWAGKLYTKTKKIFRDLQPKRSESKNINLRYTKAPLGSMGQTSLPKLRMG
ncbi:hypothetical protein RRG08_060650 [Elysia crispata]|uniref:Uncharacterized protein n=1 Tax=Elysia crispata TaxID=231223 RepID=A0AAE1ASH7_9GAST|nr:hypothetical protein RRG08_060650 [Elysia crispata]